MAVEMPKLDEKPIVAPIQEDETQEPKVILDESVKALVSFIFDRKMMEQNVVKVGYDP